jgi:hypothetical protein
MPWANSKPTDMTQPDLIVRYCWEDPQKPDRWELVQPVTLQTVVGEIVIPVGYVTDFASVPTLLWSVFPPIGRHNLAAMLHDYWYDHRLHEMALGAQTARRLADLEFRLRLDEAEPQKWFRNWLMWKACRWFGGSWWRN